MEYQQISAYVGFIDLFVQLYLQVLIANTFKSFAILEETFSVSAVEMWRKYINLRPHAGGISKVASFLGYPGPENYNGHGMALY